MILWLVAAPVVILLLALAGANWKTFHLAYCKHLIGSTDPKKHRRGVHMVLKTHLRKGMPLKEVCAMLAPARVTETNFSTVVESVQLRRFVVYVKGDPSDLIAVLDFDDNDRLRWMDPIPWYIPPPSE